MSWNGSGSYTIPFIATAGTTIHASDFNNTMNDLQTTFSNVVTRDGQGGMTGNLPLNNNGIVGMALGNSGAPSLSFSGYTGTGLYGTSTAVGLAALNTKTVEVSQNLLTIFGTGNVTGLLVTGGAGTGQSSPTLTLYNSSTGVTVNSKTLAVDSAGNLQFYNNALSGTIATLTDTGVLSANQLLSNSGPVTANGASSTAFVGEIAGTAHFQLSSNGTVTTFSTLVSGTLLPIFTVNETTGAVTFNYGVTATSFNKNP